jgi:hypothetical protein
MRLEEMSKIGGGGTEEEDEEKWRRRREGNCTGAGSCL